jgi:hypothetical protein
MEEEEEEDTPSDEEEGDNPNENCLEGKKCPECDSYGSFDVRCSLWQNVADDGTDYPHDKMLGDVEYDGNSDAKCCECGHEGKWSDFDDSADDPPSDEKRMFDVAVIRTAHRSKVLIIYALTRKEARELALKSVGDVSFPGEKEAEYSVDSVNERATRR